MSSTTVLSKCDIEFETTIDPDLALLGVDRLYARFLSGDISEDEFSALIDLYIELTELDD